jgi:hypothetical protein
VQDRPGDRLLDEPGDDDGEQQRTRQDDGHHPRVTALPVAQLAQVGPDEERADDLPLEADGLGDEQFIGSVEVALLRRVGGHHGGHRGAAVAGIGGEGLAPLRGKDEGGHHRGLGPEAAQGGGRGLGVVEEEGGDAVEAGDLRLGQDPARQPLAERVGVEGEEGDARRQQRREAAQHADADELLTDGQPAEDPHRRGSRPRR